MARSLAQFKTDTIDAAATSIGLDATQKAGVKKLTDAICAEVYAQIADMLDD